jgi:hypothetical protein
MDLLPLPPRPQSEACPNHPLTGTHLLPSHSRVSPFTVRRGRPEGADGPGPAGGGAVGGAAPACCCPFGFILPRIAWSPACVAAFRFAMSASSVESVASICGIVASPRMRPSTSCRCESVTTPPSYRAAQHLADLLNRYLTGGIELRHLRIAREPVHDVPHRLVDERRSGIDEALGGIEHHAGVLQRSVFESVDRVGRLCMVAIDFWLAT